MTTKISASDLFATANMSFFRNRERLQLAFGQISERQIEKLQTLLPVSNVSSADFVESQEYLNLITKVKGSWHNVTDGEKVVMSFFVPSSTVEEEKPTDQQMLQVLQKSLPSWLSAELFGENLRKAAQLAWNNQPATIKAEPSVYCWVAGHIGSYAGFVPLSKAMSLSPLYDVNAAIVSKVQATFDIQPYVIVQNLGVTIEPAKEQSVQPQTIVPMPIPDLSAVVEKFNDMFPTYDDYELQPNPLYLEVDNTWKFTFKKGTKTKQVTWTQLVNND